MDIGFTVAGAQAVLAVDHDPVAVRTYNTFVDDEVATCADVRDVSFPAADLVIGGPPCQGFSVAGHMDPNDPRSAHVARFMDVVERVRPKVFVMENVKALACNSRWAALLGALRERARALGYETAPWVLNAADYGVAQNRERMFLIGAPPGCLPKPPTPTTEANPRTVREVLGGLPPWGSVGNPNTCGALISLARKPVLRRSPYAGMLFNGGGRPLDLDMPAPTLPATMGGNRTPIIDQDELDHGEAPWVREYHAALCAGAAPRREAPARLRRLGVVEVAALQGFPAGMHWEGGPTSQYRQIGNAVPPPLAQAVAGAVLPVIKNTTPAQARATLSPVSESGNGHHESSVTQPKMGRDEAVEVLKRYARGAERHVSGAHCPIPSEPDCRCAECAVCQALMVLDPWSRVLIWDGQRNLLDTYPARWWYS